MHSMLFVRKLLKVHHPQLLFIVHIVDCAWDSFDEWSSCSKSCDGGIQLRSRRVMTYEANGGATCAGSSSETQICNTGSCPAGKQFSMVVIKLDIVSV